jgi:3-isopropylmalate dehydrogenase
MSPSFRLAVIGGDGIGPEVTRAALRVLDAAEQRFGFSTVREELRWSSARYIDSAGRITPEDIDGLRAFDAVLFGAIGDPRAPRGVVERDVILGMRRLWTSTSTSAPSSRTTIGSFRSRASALLTSI